MRVLTNGEQTMFDQNGDQRLSIDEAGVDLHGGNLTGLAKYQNNAEAPVDTLDYNTTDSQVEYKDSEGGIHELG